MCERQASAEIEVTPEMIAAGVEALLEFDSDDLSYTAPELVVKEILSAAISSAQ